MLATINLQPVEFTEGETILEVARRTGTFIPTLCEFAALNHRPGTCRMCLVEVTRADGTSRVVTACETRLVEGDAVDTYSHKVRRMQKLQAELLFSDHCETCSGCARHGACELQKVARVVGLDVTRLSGRLATRPVETDASANGLLITPDKCIRCHRCMIYHLICTKGNLLLNRSYHTLCFLSICLHMTVFTKKFHCSKRLCS